MIPITKEGSFRLVCSRAYRTEVPTMTLERVFSQVSHNNRCRSAKVEQSLMACVGRSTFRTARWRYLIERYEDSSGRQNHYLLPIKLGQFRNRQGVWRVSCRITLLAEKSEASRASPDWPDQVGRSSADPAIHLQTCLWLLLESS